MLRTEIRKVKLVAPALVGELSEELQATVREQAKELLGYAANEAEPDERRDALYMTLQSLEMEILDWHDVLIYQAQELAKAIDKQVQIAVQAGEYNDRIMSWPPRWDEREIAKFSGCVPDHILQKAVEIKRSLPECEIRVQQLDYSCDPFLVAVIKVGQYSLERRYLIDVWDEPGFERG
jgi:hypothetical protein